MPEQGIGKKNAPKDHPGETSGGETFITIESLTKPTIGMVVLDKSAQMIGLCAEPRTVPCI